MELCSSAHQEVCFYSEVYCPMCELKDEMADQETSYLNQIERLNEKLDEKDTENQKLEERIAELEQQLKLLDTSLGEEK